MDGKRTSGTRDGVRDSAETNARRVQVLIVEDDPSNALLIQTVLTNGGFEALATDDGEEILRRVRSGEVLAVVMDVSLRSTVVGGRKVNGLELTRMIRELAPHRVGVLLLTAHAMRGDRERFLELSTADGYMAKPIVDPDELVAKIQILSGLHPDP